MKVRSDVKAFHDRQFFMYARAFTQSEGEPQSVGSYIYLIFSGDVVREPVLRPNRFLGSAGQFLREAEGGDAPGIEKKRHPGDAYG
jgi:hypothetical protein